MMNTCAKDEHILIFRANNIRNYRHGEMKTTNNRQGTNERKYKHKLHAQPH